METKYTKGKWESRRVYPGLFQIFRNGHDSNESAIAVLDHGNDASYDFREVEVPANAKLIAAAPELLEALNEAKETLKIIAEIHPVAIGDSHTYDMTMKQIEEAIQKATT